MASPIALPVLFACLFVSILPCARGKNIPTFAGPFLFYAEEVVDCEPADNADYPDFLRARVSHFNPAKPFERQTIHGNVSIVKGWGDNFALRGTMDSFSNNQWKENAFQFYFLKNGCSALRRHVPDFYRLMFEATPKEVRNHCNVPPGAYPWGGAINWTFPHFPIMPYGRFRARVRLTLAGKSNPTYCFRIFIRIIPRPS